MARVCFNRNPPVLGRAVRPVAERTIARTPRLLDVSLDDALRHGGPLVRRALAAMALRRDRRYIVVQVQIARLAKGEIPNGPGWHTDGVPIGPGRYRYTSDTARGRPDRFHMMIAGRYCRTVFADGPIWLDDPGDLDFLARRQFFTAELAARRPPLFQIPSYRVLEFDGWALHSSVPAHRAEWRGFIRVVETDHYAPRPMASPTAPARRTPPPGTARPAPSRAATTRRARADRG